MKERSGGNAMEAVHPSMQKSKGPLIKGIVLVAFIIAAIITVRFTPLKKSLTPEMLGKFLHMAGYWGPVIFILIYAAGVCLFIPGTLLTTLGGVIFGPYQGFVYVWAGAMAGASAAFWIPFFTGTLRDVWMSGDWRGLLSPKVIFSVALFVFSFFIPKIIKKIKGE